MSSNTKNHLIDEKSPYLLQHAHNPVDWYPWSEEAFEKARKEDKPIFLSIGYSTCHWCHVMAHESFEDPEVARLMNDTFISIKVDREERPDIDGIYMTACQVMTGSGGWPLTIIMAPDKKPFFAGTYFPKNSRFGRAGLLDIIPRIKELWENKRSDLFASGEQVTLAIQNALEEAPGEKLDKKVLKTAYNQLAMRYDANKGGFSERPKFPSPHNMLFLLRFWKRTGKAEALEMVEKTLTEMRKGGIYDHLGFGFHRYSTDSNWLVPHFEKMLYDQAMLAIAYLEAYQAIKKDLYSQTAREILEYVLRDMTSDEGGFYSAEDADSEGKEGKFYVWSKKEIETILGAEDAEFLNRLFNIEPDGNFLEESTGRKTGENILHLKESPEHLASHLSMEPESLKKKFNSIREILFEHREQRIHPHKDDKILTDWNGLMLVAFAKAYKTLKDPTYLNALEKGIKFILTNLRKEDGRLLHRYREGSGEIDAYIDDHAFFIWALIEAYEATFQVQYLELAIKVNEDLIMHFWDDNIGGFYFTADDAEQLIIRQKEIYDGAIPSGNSVSMLNLLKLSNLTGDHELEEKAGILGRVFGEKVKNQPSAHTQLMCAVDFTVGPSYSAVIAGDTGEIGTEKMLSVIHSGFHPNIVLIHRPTESYPPEIDKLSSFIEWFDKEEDKATAYICIDKTCKPPTIEVEQMLDYINPKWS